MLARKACPKELIISINYVTFTNIIHSIDNRRHVRMFVKKTEIPKLNRECPLPKDPSKNVMSHLSFLLTNNVFF